MSQVAELQIQVALVKTQVAICSVEPLVAKFKVDDLRTAKTYVVRRCCVVINIFYFLLPSRLDSIN